MVDSVRRKPRLSLLDQFDSPFLDESALKVSDPSRYRYAGLGGGDFLPDDPLRGGDASGLGSLLSGKYQTTGGQIGRKQSRVADEAERLLDSLQGNPNADPKMIEELRAIVGAGGYVPNERRGNAFTQFLVGALEGLDLPRRVVAATAVDAFNIGPEFSSMAAIRELVTGRPSLDPDRQIPVEFREESGAATFTGAQIVKQMGIRGGGLGSKVVRGVGGLLIDVVLDPLSWVTFGSMGLGKSAALAGARASMGAAYREAAEALARGTVDDVADPLARRFISMLSSEGGQARRVVADALVDVEAKRLGRSLTEDEVAQLAKLADEEWFLAQADLGSVAAGAQPKYADRVGRLGEDWAEAVSRGVSANESPLAQAWNDISKLVVEKRYDTLENRWPEFIRSKFTPDHSTGGVTLTAPFFRKQVGGVKLGFRTDRTLTAPVRRVASELWERMPFPKVREGLRSLWVRRGAEAAYLGLVREGKAWSVDVAKGLAKYAEQRLGVREAPAVLSSALRRVANTASRDGYDPAEAMELLARFLDEGLDEGILEREVTSEATRAAIRDAWEQTRFTLDSLHRVLSDLEPDMGYIDNYFPMVASKEFLSLLQRMAADGVAVPLGEDIADGELRFGLTVLSEYLAAVGQREAAGGVGGSVLDTMRFMNPRNLGRTLFSPFGQADVSVLSRDALAELASDTSELGARAGYRSRVVVNDSVRKALDWLVDRGKLSAREVEFTPFSMDLPEVLQSYVSATERVVSFRMLVREAEKLGLVGAADDALEIGATLASLRASSGPFNKATVRVLRAVRDFASGKESELKLTPTTVEVIPGWGVSLPVEVFENLQVRGALKGLREAAERASKQTRGHLDGLEEATRRLVEAGVPDELARTLAAAADRPLVEAQAAILSALSEEQAKLRSAARELAGKAKPENSRQAIEEADRLAEQWAKQVKDAVEQMRRQWWGQFGWKDVQSDEAWDLLQTVESGETVLAVVAREKIIPAIDAELSAKVLPKLSPSERATFEAALRDAPADLRLSMLTAKANEMSDDVVADAAAKAFEELRGLVEISDLKAGDLLEKLGPVEMVRLLEQLAGFANTQPVSQELADVAESIAEAKGRAFMPRRSVKAGDIETIRAAYEALEDVQVDAFPAFEALYDETLTQLEALEAAGYRIVPWDGDGPPYASIGGALRDVRENKRLFVRPTGDPTEPKLFWSPDFAVNGVAFGPLFDAVHTILGHGVTGSGDTMLGVTEAWLNHGQLYSDKARGAFTTLTRGRRIAAEAGAPNRRKLALMNPLDVGLTVDPSEGYASFLEFASKNDYRGLRKLAGIVEGLRRDVAKRRSEIVVAEQSMQGGVWKARLASGEVVTFESREQLDAYKAAHLERLHELERQLSGLMGGEQDAIPGGAAKRIVKPEGFDEEKIVDDPKVLEKAKREYAKRLKQWKRNVQRAAEPSLDAEGKRKLNEAIEEFRRATTHPKFPFSLKVREAARERYEAAVRAAYGESLEAEAARQVAETREALKRGERGVDLGFAKEFELNRDNLSDPQRLIAGLAPPEPPAALTQAEEDVVVDPFLLRREWSPGVADEGFRSVGAGPVGQPQEPSISATVSQIAERNQVVEDLRRRISLEAKQAVTKVSAPPTSRVSGLPGDEAQAVLGRMRQKLTVVERALRDQYETLVAAVGDIRVSELLDNLPVDVRELKFNHYAFTDRRWLGLWDAAEEVAAAKHGVERVGGQQRISRLREAAAELADSTGVRALKLDDPAVGRSVLTPNTGVVSAIMSGDPYLIARHEGEIRRLLDMIGWEGRRLRVDITKSGPKIKYLTGDLRTVDRVLPPQRLREKLSRYVTVSPGMSTSDIVRSVWRQVDSGTLSWDVLPEDVVRFLRRVGPDGELPFEVDDYLYLRQQLLPQLSLTRSALKRMRRKASDQDWRAAYKAMSDVLDEVEPFLGLLVRGNVDKLDEVWEANRGVLERMLPPDDYARLKATVEAAPTYKKLSAHARMLVGGNVNRRWTRVSEAYDAFQRAVSEATETMRVATGADRRDAGMIIEGLDRLWQALADVEKYGEPSRIARGLDSVSPGYRAATQNPQTVEELTLALNKLTREQRSAGRLLDRLSRDETFRRYLYNEVEGLIPEGVAFDVWLADRVEDLTRPVRPTKVRVATKPMANPKVVAIGGKELADKLVDPLFAVMLESMAAHVNAMYTPLGVKLLSAQVKAFQRWWKGAVTVGRPTFNLRNLVGGLWANMAVDTGVSEINWVGATGLRIRRAMDRGLTFSEAVEKVVDEADRPWWIAANEHRIFDTEFVSDQAGEQLMGGKTSLNPFAGLAGGDKTFVGFKVGGKVMQSVEDFLRMAVWRRWYDPSRPETGVLAKEMVFAVHFDYTSLSRMESKLKDWLVPFWVWTRRNIPRQFELLFERPGMINRYNILMQNVATGFEDGEYTFADRQPIPWWMGSKAADLDTLLGGEDGLWTRLIFSPDLPTRDLEQFVTRFFDIGDFGPLRFAAENLSPVFGVPFELLANDPASDNLTNAPVGFASVLEALDALGLWWGEKKGDDPQISMRQRNLLEAAVPFLREWTEIAGVVPNDGARAGDLGYRLDDGVSLSERLVGAALGLGKAVGVRGATPHDSFGPTLDAERIIQEYENRAIGRGLLGVEGAQGRPKEPYRQPTYLDRLFAEPTDNAALVIDGDTLVLTMPDGSRETVRLAGVNTPEKGELGAAAAAEFVREAVGGGRQVRLVRDVVDRDQYGRLIRYVWVGDKLLNLELVKAGLAFPQPYPPNTRFDKVFTDASG